MREQQHEESVEVVQDEESERNSRAKKIEKHQSRLEEEVKAKGDEYVLVTSKITHLHLQIEGKQDDIRIMLNT